MSYSFLVSVSVQGSYDSALFTAREVASVPLEPAEETRAAFGNTNWFGGDDPVSGPLDLTEVLLRKCLIFYRLALTDRFPL